MISGPTLLQLCGSFADVRFMLETACEELDAECVFAEARMDPLELVADAMGSNVCFYVESSAFP